jgi:uncharacterized protein (DUF488 family)
VNLYTIGYEGLSFNSFLRQLKRHHVMIAVDIRETPISRKKGFSKSSLRQGLASNHIDYLHVKALGTPKYLREELSEKKNYFHFFRQYNHLLSEKTKYIDEIIQTMAHETVALICFEKSARKCHRSVVAQNIKKRSPLPIEIHHIQAA